MSEKLQSSFSSDKHVQVIARPRPVSDNERAQNSISCLSVNETRREIIVNCRSSTTRYFNYDHVFGFQTRQEEVFKTVVAPIIDEVLKGYSSTIFAYGQTGSGKTHTMLGKFPMDKISKDAVGGYMSILESEAGIMPRTIHHIFQGLQRQYVDYSVKITYLELYNEELTDLLVDVTNEQPEKIKIYEDKDKNNTIVGAVEATVETPFDAFKVLVKGSQRRQTAETLMNASSSRSHSIFTMMITMKDAQGDMRLGKIHLVDLAGSENISRSGATDKRAREAGTINQSLLTLGRVIAALISNEKHICYRDSKLTRILQDSLCGKTITSIIITLSPANEAETLSTLEYGHRARSLKIRPEMNQLSSKDLAREYLDEIRRLRQELDAKRENDGVPYSQYLALKNQLTVAQNLSDSNQKKLDQNEQQIEQYRNEVENLRGKLTMQEEEFRSELNERRELLILTRFRYDELVQLTDKASNNRENFLNFIEEFRSARFSTSNLIEKCSEDCRSIGEIFQSNLNRISGEIESFFLDFQRSIELIFQSTTRINEQIFLLNNKIRTVLSGIFENFHTIFSDINELHHHFQEELDRSLTTLIDRFLVEMRTDLDESQRIANHIEEDGLRKAQKLCEEMINSIEPLSRSLWLDLHSFLVQSLTRSLNQQFQTLLPIGNSDGEQIEPLDLDKIQLKWRNEHETKILQTRDELEELFADLIRSFSEKQIFDENEREKFENSVQLQNVRDMCLEHNSRIRHLFDSKLQIVFNKVRNDYDQQCGSLLNTIELDAKQINAILNEINKKFHSSNTHSSMIVINEYLMNLIKQSQRLDVTINNLQHDWQITCRTAENIENQVSSIIPTFSMPKSDGEIKSQLSCSMHIDQWSNNIENKENFINENQISSSTTQISRTTNQIPFGVCRQKNEAPLF